ncbi:MAG: ribonuclease P protein component [Aquimonas sp.]|nr:ribonuclease P protein component [Aquimonas sp.]
MPDPALPRPADYPPSARLHTPAEFAGCFQQGQRFGAQLYRCVVRPILPPGRARLGFAISRKVDKRAVVRNRLKRIARDWFRHCRHQLPAGDYVLMARPEAAVATNEALRADLQKLQRRLLALKAPGPQGTMPQTSGTDSRAPDAPAPEPPPSPSSAAASQRSGADRASE